MWLGEFPHFYDVLTDAGHEVDLVSVDGGAVPIDPVSLKTPVIQMGGTNKRYEDPEFMSLLDDRTVTGYSWTEEKLANRTDEVPFSLEDKLREQASEYTTAKIPMTKHVVVDGNLITGQNPTSAAGVGEAVLKVVG
ncbi:hypothetical protein [Corynebacterium coyleae]|uniref:hypothetical protein n=1 Tax=Corynebacterium coyleae TaxID=53374 RepID=UPI00254A431D|nr:hypothetical protein [Corynebacterium coyleae]MDK8241633.1 hypothetical protein [Corynebacterium coyleae]